MKLIPLTKDKYVMVDDIDFDYLNQWKWHARRKEGNYYAGRTMSVKEDKNRGTMLMHRQLLSIKDKSVHIDHEDRNGLNNCRSNLRVCSFSENMKNRKAWGGSKFLGVCRHVSRDKIKWRATICINKKCMHIGLFDSESSAALAYDLKAIEFHGKFANLNFK